MKLTNEDIRDIFCLIDDKIDQLENPCWGCLYFDCAKNPYNKQLKKQFREAELIDWKECLRQGKKELKRLKKLLKKKEFSKLISRPSLTWRDLMAKTETGLVFDNQAKECLDIRAEEARHLYRRYRAGKINRKTYRLLIEGIEAAGFVYVPCPKCGPGYCDYGLVSSDGLRKRNKYIILACCPKCSSKFKLTIGAKDISKSKKAEDIAPFVRLKEGRNLSKLIAEGRITSEEAMQRTEDNLFGKRFRKNRKKYKTAGEVRIR